MCLGIPGQIVELGSPEQTAVVDVLGVHKRISMALLDEADRFQVGDWVVVHMGFAMEHMEANDAKTLLDELDAVHQL